MAAHYNVQSQVCTEIEFLGQLLRILTHYEVYQHRRTLLYAALITMHA